MKVFSRNLNPNIIAKQLGITAKIDSSAILDNVAELDEANSRSVCFFENNKYLDQFQRSNAGLIFVSDNFSGKKANVILIKTKMPYITFMMLVKTWLALDESNKAIIAKSAIIDATAKVGKNVTICANVVISKGVIIEDNTKIEANTVIGENVTIGKNCHIYPNVTIYHDCIIGNENILHSGVVIGADGFGYIFHENIHHKVPQVGNVVLEDNVEIGANSCVDRGAISSTTIGAGTKLDNLVQVGHNCSIGKSTIFCAQSGVAGSTKIGDIVYIAGQVGVSGHISVGDGVIIGAQSGVVGNVEKGKKIFGTPAIDARLRKKIMISEKKLPELVKKYNREKRNDK